MKKIYRKLKKLEALAIIVSESEKLNAMRNSKYDYDYRKYIVIEVEDVAPRGMPQVTITRSSVNCHGFIKQVASYTDIPFDRVFDGWTYIEDMTDGYHEAFSSVTSMLRAAMKHGVSGLKFGKYQRTYEAIDYLDFELR